MNELYSLLNGLETDVPALDEVTLARITAKAREELSDRQQSTARYRGKRVQRSGLRLGLRSIAAVIAVLLLITAVAAVALPFWNAFFGGLDQRQQEIVDGMEVSGEHAEENTDKNTEAPVAQGSLPPPAEHDGVTVTPLRILGAKSQLYLVLEIRAPEGTVFHPEDKENL